MFKRTLGTLSLAAMISLSANAHDLLAEVSNGAISDHSIGVKILDAKEMSKVKGGYYLSPIMEKDGSALVFAIPHEENELAGGIYRPLGMGICPLGQLECYANPTTREHIDRNQGRLVDFWKAMGQRNIIKHVLVYSVKKTDVGHGVMAPTTHIYAVERDEIGNRDSWFDHEVTNSFELKYNQILREIKREVGLDLLKRVR